MRLDKRWWLLVGLVLLLALFFGFDLGRFLSLAAIKSSQADLQAWRAGQPLLAGLVFFTGYVAVAALSLPGAAVMTLAAGALFGLGWGRFPLDGRAYFRQADTYPMQGEGLVVHNVPLLYAAEMGLAGAGIWLVAVTVARWILQYSTERSIRPPEGREH